jgi:hypothetical protein
MDRSFGAPAPVPTARNLSRVASRLPATGLLLACLGILSGCMDSNVAQAPDPSVPPSANMARRQGVSPSGATVALASFSGAPQDVTDRFTPIFTDVAERGEISFTDPDKANYLVRGYLNAQPEGHATEVAFVLDIFDSKKERTQRVEDEILVKGQAADPWSLVDDQALAAVAAKSADDLAAVMSNTPEALLAANSAPPDGHNVAAIDGQTVVAATPPGAAPPSPSPPPTSPPQNGVGLAALR